MNNTIATTFTYALDLIDDLIRDHSSQPGSGVRTSLIICSTRAEFLGQILAGVRRPLPPPPATTTTTASEATAYHDDGIEGEGTEVQGDKNHASRSSDGGGGQQVFLSPILNLLGASQSIKLVFCPTIPSLRAYFASIDEDGLAAASTSASTDPGPSLSSPSSSRRPCQIIVLNLLAQHHGSSEFTLQGLSQTMATIVSAGARTKQAVRLVECKDANDPSNAHLGSTLWDVEVPLLSVSIKIGEGGARWGRRTVSVKKIAGRWFRVETSTNHSKSSRALKERKEIPDSEDEMLF